MTIIVHADKSNSFLCIQSSHEKFIEGQLYSREQIMRPLLNMLKRGSWILSEQEYNSIWHALKITNNNLTLLFIPIICSKCFPKFDDDIPIQKHWEKHNDDNWLICRRCEDVWKEEAFGLIVGTIPHKRLNTF